MTPEERAAQWKAYEEHYGPIPQPPDTEIFEEDQAYARFRALFKDVPFDSYRSQGMGWG